MTLYNESEHMASVTQDRDFPGTSPPLPGDLVSSKRHFQDWSWYGRDGDNRRKYWGRGREVLPNLTHYGHDGVVAGLFSVYQKKQQRPGDWCRRQGDGKGEGKLGELILSIPS